MSRSILSLGVAAALALGVFVGAAFDGGPSSAATGGRCKNATLVGSYGVSFDGQSTALGRFASVSIWRFDGKGRLRASEKYNSEKTGPQTRRIRGRYRVRRDCSFKLVFGSELVRQHDAHGECIVLSRGREFSCLDYEEGWQTIGTGTKVSR